MPNQIEPNVNNTLGDLLRGMMLGSKVLSENTQTFPAHPGQHADVLITAPGRSPVVVEAEYEPAPEAEKDAAQRLGLSVSGEPRTIEAAIALRYPTSLEDAYDLAQAVANARLSYCVLYEDGSRFPESGWLEGSVTDLADLVRLVSVPQKEVDLAADTLQEGIEKAAVILDELKDLALGIDREIARLLGMPNVPQTRRMACAIIANALVFHERIAGKYEGIKPLNLVCGPEVANPQAETLAAWAVVLKINYWPIFAIARDILGQLDSGHASQVLAVLGDTAQKVQSAGVTHAHDLTGRIFQRLIADRKYLATFYTRPKSAALLARLAVAKLQTPGNEVDWADPEAIGSLRIGDFACGTGALLSAVYEQVAARHQRAGGDLAALHPVMMEEVLYGCDVMPSAVHITSATLSGVQPDVTFTKSRIYTMPYGRQPDGTVSIGSLELLQPSQVLTLFNTNDPAFRTGSVGEETAAQINIDIPDGTFDIVIMNPPFTSNTKHYDADLGVLNAAFAAYESSVADQNEMAAQLRRLANESAYHGHAGLGSAFASLAHRKLKPGGVIALVLPFTTINGSAWGKFRRLISVEYSDVSVLSIAAAGDRELSFSADTGMAECLVIARKGHAAQRGNFTSLRRRTRGFAHAAAIANEIINKPSIRSLEAGPYGGTPLTVGDEFAGESLDAPIDDYVSGWGVARVLDASVAQVANLLSSGNLWLPAEPKMKTIPMVALSNVGHRGIDHQFFVSLAHKGPFIKSAPSPTATYPALWNHEAKNETRLVCLPDSQMQARSGMEKAADKLWEVASKSHITQEFRFTSQPLSVAVTDQKSIGGRAWPNVRFADSRYDSAFSLWCNCTLGLLLFWWRSSRQQSGRGAMTINGIESLPVLDFRALSDDQLATAEDIFNDFRDRELKPAYLADADPNRAHLDRRIVCDLLGFDENIYEGVRRLAAKWCAEPSVHGGKARPKNAKLVM